MPLWVIFVSELPLSWTRLSQSCPTFWGSFSFFSYLSQLSALLHGLNAFSDCSSSLPLIIHRQYAQQISCISTSLSWHLLPKETICQKSLKLHTNKLSHIPWEKRLCTCMHSHGWEHYMRKSLWKFMWFPRFGLSSILITSFITPLSHLSHCHSCLQVYNATVNVLLEG